MSRQLASRNQFVDFLKPEVIRPARDSACFCGYVQTTQTVYLVVICYVLST